MSTLTVTRTYTWGLELIAQTRPQTSPNPSLVSYYVFDGHGSVRSQNRFNRCGDRHWTTKFGDDRGEASSNFTGTRESCESCRVIASVAAPVESVCERTEP